MEFDKLLHSSFAVHGLVRGENMELGRDSDTGGQVNIIVLLLGRDCPSVEPSFFSFSFMSECN
jgi:hypothetical protein